MPVESVVPVPSALPFDTASMLGCGTLTGIGVVLNTATLNPGDAIAIFGCGGTGASAVLGAATISLGPVIVVDVVPEKLRLIEGLGATHSVDATEADPVEAIHDITDGGVQCAFDFVGFNDEVRNQAIEVTEPGGTVVLSGGAADDAQLNVSSILAEGRTVTSNVAGSAQPHLDIPRYVELYLDDDLPLDQLLTRTYDLDEIEDAFAALAAGETVKSAITFG